METTEKDAESTEHDDLLEGLDPETTYQDEVLEDEVALVVLLQVEPPTRRCEPLHERRALS